MPELGVLDAGPVIHCAELGITAAWACWERLLVPKQVKPELEEGRAVSDIPRRTRIVTVRHRRAPDSWREMSLADRCVVWLARDENAHVLTDDLEVRSAAEACGLHGVGTLGLLVLATRLGQIPVAKASSALDALRTASTLYASDRVIEHARRALASLTPPNP